jgi:Leucine-rich repeat (LRR) protein
MTFRTPSTNLRKVPSSGIGRPSRQFLLPPLFLSLRYNSLSEFSTKLELLTHLDLTGNDLTHVISLQNFPRLTTAHLWHNFLEHLPEFSPSIVTFRAAYCRLLDIHPSIETASKLLTLNGVVQSDHQNSRASQSNSHFPSGP